ncbi:MAG TPA: zf-HC2 domain-containing protein [Thermoanaerobaculia bacterium]
MQEFAPTKSRLTGSCPSDEQLAAYMDGGLDQAEKEQIAVHLISCERCYEIYSEALQFQLDSEPAPPKNVVPFPSRQRRGKAAVRYGLPIAALLLVGIGSSAYFLASPPMLTPSTMAASLHDKPALLGNFWVGPTTRGPEDQEDRPIDKASFQMGVQLVNLQLSLEAKDTEKARGDILPRIRQVLDTQTGVNPLVDSFAALSADLERKAPQEILKQFSQVAHDSRDSFDEHYLDLGQWVEAGRLAALAHNPSFFQQSETQTFLRRLRWNDKFGLHDVKLDPTTRQSLDRVSEIISKRDLRQSDYAEIKNQLEKILDHYYPMT